MHVSVERLDESKLTGKRWEFHITESSLGIGMQVARFVERQRPSKRHQTWTVTREYLRGYPEGQKNGRVTPPPRVLPKDVPLPEDVLVEARQKVIDSITLKPVA